MRISCFEFNFKRVSYQKCNKNDIIDMSSSKLPQYVLQQLPDLTEAISFPLKSTQRIKYTCFDVSKTFIAFGATSGGIYVFNRDPCEFAQLIPNKDGTITKLSISPDEKHISIANGKGVVSVTECDQDCTGHKYVNSKEHSGNEVTSLIWNGNNVIFAGDDVGNVSVLQLPNFIAKSIFQTTSLTIMNLDSRICQLDAKENMLLVSTLTKCYICDTNSEQYRQIGQKARDGEFGACLVTKEKNSNNPMSKNEAKIQDYNEVKTFNIVDEDKAFKVSEDLGNMVIFCARPSSRLWEASIDGTVQRTHQFKQVLGRCPFNVIRNEASSKEDFALNDTIENEGRSLNFAKLTSFNNCVFSFKKDALYFLHVSDVNSTTWVDSIKDIIDCKTHKDIIYVWLQNGNILSLKYMNIEKFVIKCYFENKFMLAAEMCALYSDYFVNNKQLSSKLHVLVGLREKLSEHEILNNIEKVLAKFDELKNEATQMKSGIYVVDNTYQTQTTMDDKEDSRIDEPRYNITPEALQTLKDLSTTMTDKLSTSKKILKEKWGDFEVKMKHLGEKSDRLPKQDSNVYQSTEHNDTDAILTKRVDADDELIKIVYDNNIVFKESSQNAIFEEDSNSNTNLNDRVCKALYQYHRLSIVREIEDAKLIELVEANTNNIKEVYNIMQLLEEYCKTIGATNEAKIVPNNLFLKYINISEKKLAILDGIIEDEALYKYFVESCIVVNMKNQKLLELGCDCGYPLPYVGTNQLPIYSEIIDLFIEKQWSSEKKEECYDICKKMPYLWKKILYLRRNEDLMSILMLLLQILDENLLHSFLPQFTLETWDRAIQLYAILNTNKCLNCNKSFDHISVKQMINWNDIGAMIIKSVGGRNAIKIVEKHADLIRTEDLDIKFYHTCLMAAMYEKYDKTIVGQLTDTIYSCYDNDDVRVSICNLLKTSQNGEVRNTALPLIIAAKSIYWGLEDLYEKVIIEINKLNREDTKYTLNDVTQDFVLKKLDAGNTDCSLCGLPVTNEVLIKDGGLWVFKCGHIYHGACLHLNKIKLCPNACSINL